MRNNFVGAMGRRLSTRKPKLGLICCALGGFALFLAASYSSPVVAQTKSRVPTVEEPAPATAQSPIYNRVDVPAAGAVEKEFFISGTVSGGNYKTLVHVRMPKAPVRQSGIVVVEPWHPGNLWPLYAKVSEYEAREGHVAVVVVGNPLLIDAILKVKNPSRYGGLSLPGKSTRTVSETPAGETTEFEILRQVGALIKSGKLPGVQARKVILGGMSQTAGVVRAYIAFEHEGSDVKSTYDGYFPEQAAKSSYDKPLPDLDVPVVEMEGERELLVLHMHGLAPAPYERPDGPLYRLYEVPGMPHVATRGRPEGGGASCSGHTRTDFPTFAVYSAVLNNMIAWVDKGTPAPHVSRIVRNASGREIIRDPSGNAGGGYRTSYLDVPIATYHATWGSYYIQSDGTPSDAEAARCDKMGWVEPLPQDQLHKLYSSHDDYFAKVTKSLDGLVAQGMILREDANELREEARLARIP